MSLRLVFREDARREFDAAGDWYAQERSGLGLEFLAEIDRLLQAIMTNPDAYPVVFRDVHKAVANRFPYSVYYRRRDSLLVVLAVFHSARNPAHWKVRS